MNLGNKYYEIIISISGLALLGILFAVTGLYLSPFILMGAIFFLLYPFRKTRLIKILLSLSVIIFILWVLNSLSQILVPFVFAFILSYILNPLVEKLSKKNLSRGLASGLIILGFILVFATMMFFLAPMIVTQFSDMITYLPNAVKDFDSWLKLTLFPKLATLGIPTENIQQRFSDGLPNKIEKILNGLLNSLSLIFGGLSIVLSQVVNLILIPFLTFYILKDFDDLKTLVKNLLPKRNREKYIESYDKIDNLMGSYLRGALICALIHGIIVFIFLTVIGVKYAIFLSALSALLNLIPYFGLLVAMTLATVVAAFSGEPSLQIPLVIICYLLQNLLETSFIIPKIIGKKIGLHPAILILSLLVFSYFFGFIGLLIALPVVSILIMFFKEWMAKREETEETTGDETEDD